MTVIARDAVAADHLVYAWPFPLGPECEVSCREDEQVVMCPSWLVGDRLGPGRHIWRTPDPMRPVSAFFVLTAPVEVSFDMMTIFLIPATGQPVRLRAVGSLQVRCADPGLLIAQFVGLPFDHVNEGVLRSVSRSVERMLARLLTRRVVLAGTPYAVTDPSMLGQIIEELVAYNPTAGAVFGVELIRMGHLAIAADDGSSPYVPMPVGPGPEWPAPHPSHAGHPAMMHNGEPPSSPNLAPYNDIPLLETARGRPMGQHDHSGSEPVSSETSAVASGEISTTRKKKETVPGVPAPPIIAVPTTPPVGSTKAIGASGAPGAIDGARSHDEITEPGVKTPLPGSMVAVGTPNPGGESRGSILGIGVGPIGSHAVSGAVSGEIPLKVAPGQRVLVPGPNGLMQSATVRQLLQGYYELEVGSSGETIWVPIGGVVPE